MMHILLMILKIIGIVLLAAAGFLLLMLLLALFCPVAYRGRFKKSAENMNGSVSVTWLFRLIGVTVFYDNGDRGFRIRILGIPLDAVGRLLAWRRSGKAMNSEERTDTEKEKDAGFAKGPPDPGEEEKLLCGNEKSGTGKTGDAETSGGTEKKPFFLLGIWRRIVSFFRMLADLPQRILQAVRGFFQKILVILKKIEHFREFLFSEEFINAFSLVRGSMGKLLRHVRPRKIRGYLNFGFEDPCHTGLCLGAVSVAYPWYRKTLTIEPDFQHKVLEADLCLRGRVFGVYALYIFIKVYFDKNIKYMIRKFRDKEAR